MDDMELKLIGGALGAEVQGIDLTGDTGASTYRTIRELLVEHEVLFFPRPGCKSCTTACSSLVFWPVAEPSSLRYRRELSGDHDS